MPGAGEQRHYAFSLTGRVKSAISLDRVMTSEDVKFAISVGMPNGVDKRFDDTNRLIEARFQIQDEKLDRVERVMDARLRHIEDRG